MEQFLEWFTETQMFEVFLTDKVETKNKSKTSTLSKFSKSNHRNKTAVLFFLHDLKMT